MKNLRTWNLLVDPSKASRCFSPSVTKLANESRKCDQRGNGRRRSNLSRADPSNRWSICVRVRGAAGVGRNCEIPITKGPVCLAITKQTAGFIYILVSFPDIAHHSNEVLSTVLCLNAVKGSPSKFLMRFYQIFLRAKWAGCTSCWYICIFIHLLTNPGGYRPLGTWAKGTIHEC